MEKQTIIRVLMNEEDIYGACKAWLAAHVPDVGEGLWDIVIKKEPLKGEPFDEVHVEATLLL